MPPVIEPRVVSPGFNARVYAVVRQVPAGFVTTYGQVATLLGSPRVARHVGFALAALLRTDEPVPWHRVINAQGRISHRGDVHRASEQQRMLEREGVRFDPRGRVDLARFRYTFPAFRWPEEPVDPELGRTARPRTSEPRKKTATKQTATKQTATKQTATKQTATKQTATKQTPTKQTRKKTPTKQTPTKRRSP